MRFETLVWFAADPVIARSGRINAAIRAAVLFPVFKTVRAQDVIDPFRLCVIGRRRGRRIWTAACTSAASCCLRRCNSVTAAWPLLTLPPG